MEKALTCERMAFESVSAGYHLAALLKKFLLCFEMDALEMDAHLAKAPRRAKETDLVSQFFGFNVCS
jgi:hypothetical protein